MKWLNKIFKGSNHRILEGKYQGVLSDENRYWDMPSGTLDGHGHSGNEDLDHAIALSLSEEEQRKENNIGGSFQVDNDEELARALQASLDNGSPTHSSHSAIYPSPHGYPTGYKICAGCNTEIGYGRFLSCMGAISLSCLWRAYF